jgi:hypothetical protein
MKSYEKYKIISALIFSFFLLLNPSSINAATIINPSFLIGNSDLSNGLVGYWTFDGPKMIGGVLDSSGNGNTGTLSDYTSTTTMPGKLGQAIDFVNGSTTVSINNADTVESLDNLALSFWIYPRSDARNSVVSAWVNNNQTIFEFNYQANSNVLARVQGSLAASDVQINKSNIPLNSWSHVVIIYDGYTKLYLNGNLLGTSVTAGGTTRTGPNDGIRFNGDGTYRFDGSIDDVRIYNRALSANEIQKLFNKGQTKTAKTQTPSSSSLSNGLVGHWTFDGPKMIGGVLDSSGNGKHGVLNGQTSTTTVPGRFGQALYFDNTNDFVAIPGFESTFDGATAMSVSAWFKMRLASNVDGAIAAQRRSGFAQWLLQRTTCCGGQERLTFSIFTSSGAASVTRQQMGDTDWHHAVGVYDGTNVYLYVDNVLAGTTPQTGGINDFDYNVCIGTSGHGNCIETAWLDGTIDDVRLYNRALTAEEVSRLFNTKISISAPSI